LVNSSSPLLINGYDLVGEDGDESDGNDIDTFSDFEERLDVTIIQMMIRLK